MKLLIIIIVYIAIRLIEKEEEKQKVPYLKYITNKEKT
jgi:hypothetical protein